MNLSIAQIRGMIFYEVLMHWRRGWLRIAIVTFIVIPALLMLAVKEGFPGSISSPSGEYSSRAVTDLAVFITFGALPMVLIAFPVLVADTIPLDHLYGVRDILRALPLRYTTYLADKVLGVWVGIILSMVISAAVLGVAFWWLVSAFDIREWLEVWMLGLLLFAFLTSSVSVLLAVNVPTRRRAVLIGLALTPLFLAAFINSPLGVYYIWVMTRSSTGEQGIDLVPNLPPIQTPQSLAIGIVVIALASGIAWLEMRGQENKE